MLCWRIYHHHVTAIYQHYTILPIHADQPTEQMQAYQIKECSGQPLSIWDKHLDLMYFPDLFPRGRFGKYEPRAVRISDADYRVARLLNSNGHFRCNQQYLFHLLFDSDIRNYQTAYTIC